MPTAGLGDRLPAHPPQQTRARYLLAVGIREGQTEVVLLQEVQVLTDQVKQYLAPAVLLREREELCEAGVPAGGAGG